MIGQCWKFSEKNLKNILKSLRMGHFVLGKSIICIINVLTLSYQLEIILAHTGVMSIKELGQGQIQLILDEYL